MNYSIFDVDGTILDSMEIWNTLASRYIQGIGLIPEVNLDQIVSEMSLEQSAKYLKKQYEIDKSESEIMDEILNLVSDFYKFEVQLKLGFKDFISNYDSINVIGTSSDEKLVEAALKRLDVLSYFEKIITCTQVHKAKSDPDFYLACANVLNQKPKNVVVFEDAKYCICAAKKAGFQVVGIQDMEDIRSVCDMYIKDWRDLNEKCINDCGK